MSTVKANYLQHPSSTTANLTLESDGSVSGGLPTAGRNLLYNGAMQVAQRGTSTAGISSGISYYTADRWLALDITLGTWTQSVENDAPAGTGFRKSLKMLCTAADATPAASDALYVGQGLEGQDLQRIAKGTSSAKELTLSFWVKANVTGTYAVGLYDIDNSRFVSKNYTISASATWEKKTVTFPADTTGAFDNDNAGSLRVNFWLASGSDYSGGSLPTTWGSSSGGVANGQVNLASATNNYWQVTGVQLEVGPVATPFEFESYGDTLRKCMRYYWRTTGGYYFGQGVAYNTAGFLILIPNPVPLRTVATSVDFGTLRAYDGSNPSTNVTSIAVSSGSGVYQTMLEPQASSLTQYRPYLLINTTGASYVGVSAEL